MPPAAVKTVKEIIFYQYAKLIAKKAGYDGNFRFIMAKFRELRTGEMAWHNLTREYELERSPGQSCVYCESAQGTSLDHIIPFSKF